MNPPSNAAVATGIVIYITLALIFLGWPDWADWLIFFIIEHDLK